MSEKLGRQHRIATRLLEDVTELLLYELSDPRLNAVTLTRVEVSGDLSRAKLYYTAPDGDTVPLVDALNRANGYIRRSIAQTIQLRHVPELKFLYDKGYDHSIRIHQLLDSLKDEQGSDETQ